MDISGSRCHADTVAVVADIVNGLTPRDNGVLYGIESNRSPDKPNGAPVLGRDLPGAPAGRALRAQPATTALR